MNFAKWDPFTEIGNLQEEINKIFYEGFGSQAKTNIYSPKIELSENAGEYRVKADLPGIEKDAIDISVLDKTLTIKGERKEQEEKEFISFKKEISYGAFQRQVILPENIDGDNIKASFENGVLELTIPKSEKRKERKITID